MTLLRFVAGAGISLSLALPGTASASTVPAATAAFVHATPAQTVAASPAAARTRVSAKNPVSMGVRRAKPGQRVAARVRVRLVNGPATRVRLVARQHRVAGHAPRTMRAVKVGRTSWRPVRVVHHVRQAGGNRVHVILRSDRPVVLRVQRQAPRRLGRPSGARDRAETGTRRPITQRPAAGNPVPRRPEPKPGPGRGATPPKQGPKQPTPPTKPAPQPAPDPTPKPTTDGWRLHWSDEFSGSQLDRDNWRAYHNTYGDGNNELACLTPGNVRVADGAATILSRAQRETCPGGSQRNFTSGFLGSREAGRYFPLYGRFEIRAKVPHGQGLWPAFWLRHRNGSSTAEVDIMEYFYSQVPGRATHTLHFPTSLGTNVWKTTSTFQRNVSGAGISGWHTFSVDIERESGGSAVRFTFRVDGEVTGRYTNTRPSAWTDGVDRQGAWDIAINTAVGGNWAGHPQRDLGYLAHPDVCSLTYRAPAGGNPANCPTSKDGNTLSLADFPASYVVDYVRVYRPE